MTTVKILIVDDNAIVRQMVASLAREIGFLTIEAASADAARVLLDVDHVDALLCDDDLGVGQSGLEFINIIPAQTINTVVLMSGNPKPDGLPESVLYLGKPFTIRELETALLHPQAAARMAETAART